MGFEISMEERRLLKKKARDFKMLIVGNEPIKGQHDYFMTGVCSIHAGASIIAEFLKLSSVDLPDFENTKDYAISVFEQEIKNLKELKYITPGNVVSVNFAKSAVQHDQ